MLECSRGSLGAAETGGARTGAALGQGRDTAYKHRSVRVPCDQHCDLSMWRYILPSISFAKQVTQTGCAGSAPTFILEARVDNQGNSVSAAIPHAYISYPKHHHAPTQAHISKLKHLSFDGELLHSISPQLADPSSSTGARVTLLVNIWLQHKPVGVQPVGTMLAKLMCPLNALHSRIEDDCGAAVVVGAVDDDMATSLVSFGLTGTEHKVKYRMPQHAIRNMKQHLLKVVFEEGLALIE